MSAGVRLYGSVSLERVKNSGKLLSPESAWTKEVSSRFPKKDTQMANTMCKKALNHIGHQGDAN